MSKKVFPLMILFLVAFLGSAYAEVDLTVKPHGGVGVGIPLNQYMSDYVVFDVGGHVNFLKITENADTLGLGLGYSWAFGIRDQSGERENGWIWRVSILSMKAKNPIIGPEFTFHVYYFTNKFISEDIVFHGVQLGVGF